MEVAPPRVRIDTDDDLTRSGLARIAARAGLAVARASEGAAVVLRASATDEGAGPEGGGGAEMVVTSRSVTIRVDLGAADAVVRAVCQLLATVWNCPHGLELTSRPGADLTAWS
ncbi:MAG TPA: hypothetical protein VME46_04640 [Acidimicrobiales bacterium]|nr:hypothetical protein [Acidimicrobiales bacterium]